MTLKDMKQSLKGIKPDISHVRFDSMVYESRPKEYGCDKYTRSNYLRPSEDDREAWNRFRSYIRGMVAHGVKTLDSMEAHQAQDPDLLDGEGMRAACFAPDTEIDGSGFPPSHLPHVAHALASGSMGVCLAIDYGLLPKDPGQPWKETATPAPATDFDFDDEPTLVREPVVGVGAGVYVALHTEAPELDKPGSCERHAGDVPRSWCEDCQAS